MEIGFSWISYFNEFNSTVLGLAQRGRIVLQGLGLTHALGFQSFLGYPIHIAQGIFDGLCPRFGEL